MERHSPSTVTARLPGEGQPSITTAQGDPRLFHLAIDSTGDTVVPSEPTVPASFLVTNESWQDERFVAWLEKTVRN